MANPLNLSGGPKGIRTPVTDVRGQCPRPLDDGTTSLIQFQMSNFKVQINSNHQMLRETSNNYLVTSAQAVAGDVKSFWIPTFAGMTFLEKASDNQSTLPEMLLLTPGHWNLEIIWCPALEIWRL